LWIDGAFVVTWSPEPPRSIGVLEMTQVGRIHDMEVIIGIILFAILLGIPLYGLFHQQKVIRDRDEHRNRT
jgi:hypothetical protein